MHAYIYTYVYTIYKVYTNVNIHTGIELNAPEAFFKPGKLDKISWTNKMPYDGIHTNIVGNAYMADAVFHDIVEFIYREKNLPKIYNHKKIFRNVTNNDPFVKNFNGRLQMRPDGVYEHVTNFRVRHGKRAKVCTHDSKAPHP
jgi:hypothetical protein